MRRSSRQSTVNLAFTADGLRALRPSGRGAVHVPAEFQEGIATPARSRILGDTEESAPAHWEFGGTGTDPVHAVVIIHARRRCRRSNAPARAQRALLDQTEGGVVEHAGTLQRGYRPDGDHEPFGFHDGIAQPSIAGLNGDGVPTGEFILGYRITTGSFRRRRSCRPSSIAAASCRRSTIRITRPARLRDLGLQRLVCRLSEAAAGRRRLLAVHAREACAHAAQPMTRRT